MELCNNGNQEKYRESVIDKSRNPSNLPQETTVLPPGVHLKLAPVSSFVKESWGDEELTGDPLGHLKTLANSGTFLRVPSTLQRAGE